VNWTRTQLASEADTQALAERLAKVVRPPCTIYLSGDLGAGKTTFARYFLRALGHVGPVKSPTYTLVEPYELAGCSLYHFDLYRINDPLELELAGFRDLFVDCCIRLVEWPERGSDWLPEADIKLQFAGPDAARWVDVCCSQAE